MNEAAIEVRWATPQDAKSVLAVYAPYVKGTPITFETRVPGLEEFAERMRRIVSAYPYLVAEERGQIIGYAYAHRLGERAAYAWNAELSVYLEPEHAGRGCGRALSQAIIDLLALQGVRNVFSLITVPNNPSIRMHEALGFVHMGTQSRAGFKCGSWHDVAWMQKQIGCFDGAPDAVVPVRNVDPASARRILAAAEHAIAG